MTNSETARIILPTYREAENLTTLVPAILAAAPVEILVVDDNSDDGTPEIAERFGRETGRVHLLRRPGKAGLGAAYRAGLRRCVDDGVAIIGTMDADWSHDPTHLPAMLAAARAGADLVIGSRYVPGGAIDRWSPWRRFLSSSARRAARAVLGPICFDFTSGYRLYSRRALERVPPEKVQSNSYSFLMEMATLVHRAGLKIEEVPIRFVDRRDGASKMPVFEIFRAIATLVGLGLRRS